MGDRVNLIKLGSSDPVADPSLPPDGLIRSDGTISADLAELHQSFLRAATSDNTRRTYRSAIRHFQAWGGMLPTDEASLLRYLLEHARTHNARTLALRLTALSQWHVQQGFPDPAGTPIVRKTLKRIGRTYGQPTKRAKALPIEDLQLIVEKLSAIDTLKSKRDSALLQIGYFGAFRRSELADLQVCDLAWESEGLVVTLARSKTDQEGQGIIKAIPYGDSVCCPVRALQTWLGTAGIKEGALFRSIDRWQHVAAEPMHPGSINAILVDCAELAELSYVPELSSHSLRRGLATSAHRAGADFRDIKRQGGWRHDGTVQGYIEEADRFEENAARHLLRRDSV